MKCSPQRGADGIRRPFSAVSACTDCLVMSGNDKSPCGMAIIQEKTCFS
jgi:hypothetical protein